MLRNPRVRIGLVLLLIAGVAFGIRAEYYRHPTGEQALSLAVFIALVVVVEFLIFGWSGKEMSSSSQFAARSEVKPAKESPPLPPPFVPEDRCSFFIRHEFLRFIALFMVFLLILLSKTISHWLWHQLR